MTETEKQSGVGIVKFELETKPGDFYRVRTKFIEDLAAAVDLSPEQIWITYIRTGCTIVVVLLPLEARRKIRSHIDGKEKSSELQSLEDKWDVTRAEFEDRLVGPYPASYSQPAEKGARSLTWLHLSDVHLRGVKDANQWLQDQVTDQLLRDLPSLLKDRALKPDVVFFTGDLAFSAQEIEYKVAKDFISQLRQNLPTNPRFFFVPGNHDVTWEKIDVDEDFKLRKTLSTDAAVVKHLIDAANGRPQDWTNHLKRFDNYFAFIRNVSEFGQPSMNHQYYYVTDFDHQGLRIGVAGLNSAWLSTAKKERKKGSRDPDHGKLVLGRPQVVQALKELQSSHLKLALFHHPFSSDWFRTFDSQMQKNSLSDFDFILCGHEHKAEAIGKNLGFGKAIFQLAAGALYEHPEYPNSFNVASIDFDTGFFTIYFWSYQEKRYRWDIDTSVEYTRSGRIEFALPNALRERITAAIGPIKNGPDSFGMSAGMPRH